MKKWLTKRVKELARLFLDILFPIECLGCGKYGEWICSECFNKLDWRICQQCPACGQLNHWGEYCEKCYGNLEGIMSSGNYENELLRKAIKTFKYRFVKDLAKPLSSALIIFLGEQLAEYNHLAGQRILPKVFENFSNVLLVPTPLAKRRLAWRGFNQSELLAKYLADFFNLELNVKDLKRIKNRQSQTKLKRNERQKNIQGCFVWQGQSLNKRNIILIDDIATTGATLNECGKVLKKAGAGEVWGLTLARD